MSESKSFLEQQAATLLLRYHAYVFRQARRFAPMPDLAEDIAQQVLVDFIGKADQWDLEKDLRPLLMAMARRSAQAIWREKAKMLPESLRQIAEFVRTELSEDDNDLQRRNDKAGALEGCLSHLPESGRKLVTLHYFEGMSTESLARQMDKTSNAVSQALFRIRERLRVCIERSLKEGGSHG